MDLSEIKEGIKVLLPLSKVFNSIGESYLFCNLKKESYTSCGFDVYTLLPDGDSNYDAIMTSFEKRPHTICLRPNCNSLICQGIKELVVI